MRGRGRGPPRSTPVTGAGTCAERERDHRRGRGATPHNWRAFARRYVFLRHMAGLRRLGAICPREENDENTTKRLGSRCQRLWHTRHSRLRRMGEKNEAFGWKKEYSIE